MAYLGRQPIVGNFVKLDAITTSATATYNLLNGGVAYFPQTANNCIVSLNGVIQSPTSAYTISGSTIVFSDALTSSDTIDFILVLGDVLSIGTPSDGTITSAKLASGVSGLISWQSVQTTGFTAVAGRGYPCNTTSSAFTVTLPASPNAGDTIILLDYAGTFDTNFITLAPNGNKINGSTDNRVLNTEREAVTITYVDSTQGWLASSGVNEGTVALSAEPYSVDFLVIAGGGGGGCRVSGGGGAGGYRNSFSTETSGGGGSSEASLSFVVGTVYTITVGAGGAGGASGAGSVGIVGSNSSISGTGITTITSNGGGFGSGYNTGNDNGGNGGSGGGGAYSAGSGGAGTANQGYNGGSYVSGVSGGGGGGAGAVGSGSSTNGGNGGAGLASSITGSSVTRAGGGGGSSNAGASTGGTGGGGAGGGQSGVTPVAGTAGTTNTGSGGGGGGDNGSIGAAGAAGGSGVVILRLPTASYSGTTTGSPTVTTSGSDTILVYNSSGTYTG
jgi:hypothetical protein